MVTSAHCNENHWWPAYQFIRAGSSFPESEVSEVYIEKWITHPRYDEVAASYDLALIELKTELVESDKMHSIEMADKTFAITDDLVVRTAAFGMTCDNCNENKQLFELIQTTCLPAKNFKEKEKIHTLLDTNGLKKFDDEEEETVMCSIDKNLKATGK